jgi:hypothetical protein
MTVTHRHYNGTPHSFRRDALSQRPTIVTTCPGGILRQSHKGLNLIAIDDGSTDRTPAILKRLARSGSRVNILTLDTRCGIAMAFNKGVEAGVPSFTALP